MSEREEAVLIRLAFELFPMDLWPNIIDNRYMVDINQEKRQAWLTEHLGRPVE